MEDPKEESSNPAPAPISPGLQFVWEIVVFLTGLFIGFFWYMYVQNSPNTAEAHIIIGLLVIIICMSRYVYILWQRQK